MERGSRLVVFDVEGVLLPKRRYMLFEVSRRLSLWGFIQILITGLLYEAGLLPLENALKRVFSLMRGLRMDDLLQLFRRLPLMPGAKELVRRLKEAGYLVALISSGLPRRLVQDLASRLGADFAVGLSVEVVDGWLTGRVRGDVAKPDGKAVALRKLMKRLNVSRRDCVVVADDRNNLPMFPMCRVRIGFNPDFLVAARADVVVRRALLDVAPIILEEGAGPSLRPPSRREVIRESIHIGSILVPVLCMHLVECRILTALILLVAVGYFVSEVARMRGRGIPPFSWVTRRAAIGVEICEPAVSPLLFAAGMILALSVFPLPERYAAAAVLSLGDGVAALSGACLGRTVLPINKGKHLEGTILGFFASLLGALIFVDPVKALVAAAAGMMAESLPLPINDNIVIPVFSGLAMMAVP